MGLREFINRYLLRVMRRSVDRRLNSVLHEVRRARSEAAAARNPLLQHGAKYFSQNDEDGILLEILRRIGISGRELFVELGVGNGLENNTLILLAQGWRGVWVGGEKLAFPTDGSRLAFLKAWITADNAMSLVADGLRRQGQRAEHVRVASVDLDGNDFHIVQAMLATGLLPDVVIVEYNAKFPPPIEFVMDYDPSHVWTRGDFFGASLASWQRLMSASGYRLVACNSTGVNAFFVRSEHSAAFADVPTDERDLYMPGSYDYLPGSGHPTSPRTVEHLIGNSRSGKKRGSPRNRAEFGR